MRKLVVFNNVTLDGYFASPDGHIAWAHRDTQEAGFSAFVADNAKSGRQLLLGRKTYQLMAGYWPTPMAMRNDPIVAERMNALPKIVFSRTMDSAAWSNTTVMKGDLATAVRKLKGESGPDMVILGSGSIVAQLAQAGLIDEYQLVVNPVVIGGGRTMFDGVTRELPFKPTTARVFKQGKVLLCYEPAGSVASGPPKR